jgi:hypothetical protein
MGGTLPGPYSTKYHPWCREIADSPAQYNWVMKAAQIGVTEAAINRALFTIDRLKRDVLYVLPTTGAANDFSRTRFKTALELSPHLKSIFTDVDTVGLKQAGSTNLYIRGSGGRDNLISLPASVLILDELDRMDHKKVWLALERLSGQFEKSVFGISTPTLPGHGIHLAFDSSTQEHFHFRCPSCNRMTRLVWPDCIEIVGDYVSDSRCHESFLKCKECKARLPHETKSKWLSQFEWVAHNTNADPEVRGFAVSQMYSPTITPGELVVAYFRGFGDEAAKQEFYNSKLGLPYLGDGAKVTELMIQKAIGTHSIEDARPPSADKVRVLGVDQGKWNYAVAVEWDYPRRFNDINSESHGKILWAGKFTEDQWSYLDTLMTEWQIYMAVIDADPEINQARRFARGYPGYVNLCRYRRGVSQKEIKVSDEDDAPLATVDRSNWLSATLGRFKVDPPRITIPYDLPQEFHDHIQSVVARYEDDDMGNPRLKYISTGPDHYTHALNYAEIALKLAVERVANTDIKAVL